MNQTKNEFLKQRVAPLKSSKKIVDEAMLRFIPRKNVMMLSGGDDSLTALHVSLLLGVRFDALMFARTGTGIKETEDFVQSVARKTGIPLIIADAGISYKERVLEKGFFGVGRSAHSFAYHLLKASPIRSALSSHFRQRRHNYNILLFNGARQDESENRKKNMVYPFRRDPSVKSNIWVNVIHHWSHHQCLKFLQQKSITRNPVAKLLCRSGECWCGTMQSQEAYLEAKIFFPEWGEAMDSIRREVVKKHDLDWGVPYKTTGRVKNKNQQELSFQPMCTSCNQQLQKEGKL